jgi:hypothetical protein
MKIVEYLINLYIMKQITNTSLINNKKYNDKRRWVSIAFFVGDYMFIRNSENCK